MAIGAQERLDKGQVIESAVPGAAK